MPRAAVVVQDRVDGELGVDAEHAPGDREDLGGMLYRVIVYDYVV